MVKAGKKLKLDRLGEAITALESLRQSRVIAYMTGDKNLISF